jgi:hypothetical protein
MKLWAVAMVRNEVDIIEAFARHNLAFVDGLAMLDHRSTDGTYEVLGALQAEGLPVARLRTFDTAFFKGSHVSALARECFTRTGADFVFALDADEFICAPSRAALEGSLAQVPPVSHGLHRWRSYVPTSFDGRFGPHCLRFRMREEPIPRYKVIIRRLFAERPHEMVSEGNHRIVDIRARQGGAHHLIAPDALCLAHCPVRSAKQLSSKARLGYEARLAAANGAPDPGMSFHWREICEDLDRGVELDESRLRLIAMNYTLPRAQWTPAERVALVEDPLELRAIRGPPHSPFRSTLDHC